MFKRHQHVWKDESASHLPSDRPDSVRNVPPNLLRELVFGLTVVTQRCTECNELAYRKILGNVKVKGFTFPK